MHLENALEKAAELCATLAAELEEARGERLLLRRLDAAGLFERAARRAGFLEDVARLERELAAALARAAGTLGLPEVTLERLRERAPREAESLSATLSDIRFLAAALREIDRLNFQLAHRAMAVVRGYAEALNPTPRAYDRRGAHYSSAPGLASVAVKG
jgi:hypothetical protein